MTPTNDNADVPRWQATVTYRTDDGPLTVIHDIEELEELQNLIELGPDWNAIIGFDIKLSKPDYDYTVLHADE